MNIEQAGPEFRLGLEKAPSTKWATNVETKIRWTSLSRNFIPVTANKKEFDSSYVVSPFAALILYSRQELVKLPKIFRVIELILLPLGGLLKWIKLNQIISVNNWLLSTNLLPAVNDDDLVGALKEETVHHPESFVMIRSLNRKTNAGLMQKLKSANFTFIPSRQVYLFDFKDPQVKSRNNFKMDRRLLKNSALRFKPGVDFSEQDFSRAEYLYGLLYLEKYSIYNPAFTKDYLKLCHSSGTMQFFGLYDPRTGGELLGVVGFFTLNQVMTVPIVGYDTKAPAAQGLYRLLMAFSMKCAEEHGYLLNLSSGASGFKRLRGGRPYTEYSAVYIRHLALYRRLGFRVVQALLYGLALPLLKIFKL